MKTDILHAALFTPTTSDGAQWGLPIIFEGDPGVSKTAVVRSYAARLGWRCEILSPGERGEGAFGVVPVPRTSAGVLTYPPPDWAGQLIDEGRSSLVFTDEVTTAPPMLQAAMLGLIAGKRIGAATLPGRTRVLGACNPPHQAAGGYELSPPLANRFGHIPWDPPTVADHAAYMLRGGALLPPIDADAEEKRVLAQWGDAYAYAVGVETAFLRAQPSLKNKLPAGAAQGRAWPSDRTWEMATLALASARVHGLASEDTDTLVSGFIGQTAYVPFAAFIRSADLPSPGDLLDGKVQFAHNPDRLDRTYAVLSSCTALVVPPKAPDRERRSAKLYEILNGVGDEMLDLAVPTLQAMLGAKLPIPAGDHARGILARVQRILSELSQ